MSTKFHNAGSTKFRNACNMVYGSAAAPKHANILGRLLQGAADCIGGGTLSYQDMLMNHSAVGFYSRLVPASVEFDWAQRMAGDLMTRRASAAYPCFLVKLRSPSMKYCPVCANSDMKNTGFPVWRVIHQLPFVEVCSTHRVTLVHSCSHCGESLDQGRNFRLPGQSCCSCGARQAHSVNRQQAMSSLVILSELCEKVFSGSQKYLRPENWLLLVKALRAKHSIEKLTTEVHRRLENLYGRDSNVAPPLAEAISKRSVEAQLTLLARPHEFLSRILVGDQLARMGLVDRTEVVLQRPRTDECALEMKAVEQGIPAGYVGLLLNGVSPSRICQDHGASHERLVAFRASIPPGYQVSERLGQWKANRREAKKLGLQLAKRPQYRAVLDQFVKLNPGCRRQTFSAAHPYEAVWLRTNDRPYFDATLPAGFRSHGKSVQEKRAIYRALIRELLRENPQISRREIARSKYRRLSDFLGQHDKAWFDATVPYRSIGVSKAVPSWYAGPSPFIWPDSLLKRRYTSIVERRNCCRTYVSKLIELNPQLTVAEVKRAGYKATEFLRYDSPEWLAKKLANVKKQSSDGSGSQSEPSALLEESAVKRKGPLPRSKGS
ncbi:TniQ family protein [Variovorax sp. YR750]|uniref:TniQ family protein n=1 Tax=Variovorax sp. YR750 TaxID=1884384 RepID=UPI0015A5EF13|nr:TniQ family protein [Variovorax sp. YR750]